MHSDCTVPPQIREDTSDAKGRIGQSNVSSEGGELQIGHDREILTRWFRSSAVLKGVRRINLARTMPPLVGWVGVQNWYILKFFLSAKKFCPSRVRAVLAGCDRSLQ